MTYINANNIVEILEREMKESWSRGFFHDLYLKQFIMNYCVPDKPQSLIVVDKDIVDAIKKNIFTLLKPYWEDGRDKFVVMIVSFLTTSGDYDFTYLSDGKWNSSIWNGCINMPDDIYSAALLNVFMEHGNYHIKTNGNPIRNAVYANKLEIASLLIDKGIATPKTISLFQINNMINWDPTRMRFLLDHGCVLEFSDKELDALDIIRKEILHENITVK